MLEQQTGRTAALAVALRAAVGDERFSAGKYDEARELFEQVALADDFEEFLTVPAYARLA